MNDLEIGLLIGGVIGYAVCSIVWRYRIFKAVKWFIDDGNAETFKEKFAELQNNSDEETTADSKVLKVNIEEHNGEFFLYRDTDHRFIAQGKTMEDFTALLPCLNVTGFNIINGKSNAAQALLKTVKQNENSNSIGSAS